MATFLIKSEPGEYSWDDLVRERGTTWSGVSNPAAQMHMRSIAEDDDILFYHTGGERRIVGLARATRGAYPDPEHPGLTAAGAPRRVLFDLAPTKSAGSDGASLAAIKSDPRFAGFALVRESRLSVMPVPAKLDKALRKLAGL